MQDRDISDKRWMITALVIFIFCCGVLHGQQVREQPYWYVNGAKYYWHYQSDVFAYRTVSGDACPLQLDTNYVKYKFYRELHRDKMNIVYFKPGISDTDKEHIKNTIRYSTSFANEFPVITLYPDLTYESAAWFVLDNLILVNFDRDKLTKEKLLTFRDKYHLRPVNFSGSIEDVGTLPTYIFEYDPQDIWPDNSLELTQRIFTGEDGLVNNVQPNLINAYREVSDDNSEMNTSKEQQDIEYYIVNDFRNSVKIFVNFHQPPKSSNIKIYDMFGREVYKHEVSQEKVTQQVDISAYITGYYFSCIETADGEVLGVQKFQKL